ncbi:HDOD domain-containing protein [Gimesia aquarii]|uniref:HDOD domain-containing protein n=1 Tax=Gimesia aquarii TaxID=2527964 RepID=A0A517WZW9_9PLAN|nr:HDOD domain-containing protein [Gimesia aquarii]QDU10799.1 hypothetical protein V202x_42120 [Gimesia aquarii]
MNEKKLNEIFKIVRKVPPLPEVAQELSRLAGDPKATAQDMASVAETDSGLAAQILRVVNSSFFGFSRQINTIPQAIVVLGTHGVRNIALGLAVTALRPNLSKDAPLFKVDDFWRHSLSVAIGARQLAKHLAICDPEEAFLAGLLHDIGKLLLIEAYSDQYIALITTAHSHQLALHTLENAKLGLNHAEVGFALCERWKIPQSVAHTVQNHHFRNSDLSISSEPDQLLFLVNAANNLAKVSGIGFSGNTCATPFGQHFSFTGGSLSEAVQKTLLTLPTEVAHTERLFNITSQQHYPTVSNSAENCVGIVIQDPHLFQTISLLLLSQGIETITVNEQIPSGASMIAVLTDEDTAPETLPDEWSDNTIAYHHAGIVNHDLTHDDSQLEIDIEQLRVWLNDHLTNSAMQETV